MYKNKYIYIKLYTEKQINADRFETKIANFTADPSQ